MVHHGHQHVLVLGDAEKPCPQRDLGGQIKLVTHRGADSLIQPACRPAAGINDLPAQVGPLDRHNDLLRYPVRRHKQCAQALMSAHQIGQCRTQRPGVKRPIQPQRHRHVVNRRRPLQLIDKPQPLLGERQRNHRRPLNRDQRLEPTRALTDPGRQLGHRGCFE